MKVTKPTPKKAIGFAGQAAAIVGGMMLSNGVSSVIPFDNKTAVKGILAAAGIVGASVFAGSDTTSKAIQSICVGITAQQAKELVKELGGQHLPADDGTAVKSFVNAMFEQGSGAVATSTPALNSPYKFALANGAQPQPVSAPVKKGFSLV